ncbi:MAG: Clp protease N-terminal domain-containing protein, partial [Anaerovoracaceae bacterium]|nr:Clp protease N-terminal domain-containing protein [Anaerovoracaceae bacterium]
MNIEKFTQSAQRAIVEAQNIAADNGNQALEVEHLLVALLKESDGLISKLIIGMGVEPGHLKAEVEREINKFPKV